MRELVDPDRLIGSIVSSNDGTAVKLKLWGRGREISYRGHFFYLNNIDERV